MPTRAFRGGAGNPLLAGRSPVTLNWGKGLPSTKELGSVPQQRQQARVNTMVRSFGNIPRSSSLFNHSGMITGEPTTPTSDIPPILLQKQKQQTSHDIGFNIDNAAAVHPVGAMMPMEGRDEFWRKVPIWENVSAADFLSYRWGVSSVHISF